MHRYFIFSIPLMLALIVGLIAYGVRLSALDVPTEADIAAAPEYKAPAQGGAEEKEWDAAGFMNNFEKKWKNGDKPENGVSDRTSRHPRATEGRTTRRPWRQELQSRRAIAYDTAQKTGATAAVATAILAYVGLGAVLIHLGKKRPKQGWREAIARAPSSAIHPVTPSEDDTYDDGEPDDDTECRE